MTARQSQPRSGALPQPPPPRTMAPGQRAQLWVANADTGTTRLLLESDTLLFEAPNWTQDGQRLIVNGAGTLWSVDLHDATLEPISITGVPDLNNDHVLAPDGQNIYLSAMDWHIYRAPLAGGQAARISSDDEVPNVMHFLHGVSPDGQRLSFIGIQPPASPDGTRWPANVLTMTTRGTDYLYLTDTDQPADGCEYSPDGTWIYFNTEQFTGHAQLARIPAVGGTPQQVRESDNVDWFPHLSPDGHRGTFVAFPPGTEGHPADLWVDIMLAPVTDWQDARSIARIYGGQGSLNVNSWAPDNTHFAYVAYPKPARVDDHDASRI